MIASRLLALASVLGFTATLLGQAPPPPPDLANYVNKEDKSFVWQTKEKKELPIGTVHQIEMTSQTWQEIPWKHTVEIYVPKGAKPNETMVLYNTGGNPSATGGVLGLAIADRVKAPVAFLFNIPNQPLFGGKTEDALIAETFKRFLATNDSSWPLLFPMAKSVVRSMDAVQGFAKKEWNFEVKNFVVTGASKRGWTSWMTAASGDPRVKAIAPLVIDTLNLPAQIENQKKAFGTASEQVRDYTNNGLLKQPESSGEKHLQAMIDPYSYRDKLTLPKMLIHGTNDPYWPQDALNSYWDGLKGEKHITYVPNAGHDLRELDKDGKKELIPMKAINALSAFSRSQMGGKPIPNLIGKHGDKDGKAVLSVECDQAVKSMRILTANSKSLDFRKSKWESQKVEGLQKVTEVSMEAPKEGYRAFLVEAEFEDEGLVYTLSTQIRILEAKK